MEQEEQKLNSLPDNAYRELKPGEVYKPIMPANSKPREVTTYSVVFGIIMAIVFSAAAAYLGLKVGQVFEAAIPIAIIAVGCGNLMKKNNMLGQNVIIQSIGASSGVIVAGAIFTLPALYILGLDAKFYQIFLSSLLGGLLGILMLIPFRKYFVKDMHGKYPFPEATATTEVLVSGEKKGNQAKLLAVSGLVGGLYDFFISTFGVALLVGATIPQTGTIGFIGLIAPHFARILLKARPSQLYLTSALIGALLLLLADLAILYIPLLSHIYIGTLTALIGAPCLIWMLLTQQRKIYD